MIEDNLEKLIRYCFSLGQGGYNEEEDKNYYIQKVKKYAKNLLFDSAIDEVTLREKRLLRLMDLGLYIISRDGHIWIEEIEDADSFFNESFNERLRKAGIMLNNKIYGGVDEALYVIDNALSLMGEESLEDGFSYEPWQMRAQSIYADSRIDIVEKGNGGLC